MPYKTMDDSANWKGDEASNHAKRDRARKLYPLGPCEVCGKPGIERHHKDNDPGNNDPSNIQIVCRKCHITLDGRIEQIRQMARRRWERRKRDAVA